MVLFLNDIATSEVLLILVFVLIFFGAKSIPGLARTLGRTIRQVKDASSEIQREIKKSSAEMKSDLNLNGIIEETAEDIKRPFEEYKSDLDEAIKYQPPRKSHLAEAKKVPDTLKQPAEIKDEKVNKNQASEEHSSNAESKNDGELYPDDNSGKAM